MVRLGLIHSWVIPKTLNNGICCFSCINAQYLRVAQRIKKESVDYTLVKENLIQSGRYKIVIKRHKNY